MASSIIKPAAVVCIPDGITRQHTDGIFFKDSPFSYSLPRLMLQIVMATVFCQTFYLVLRPLRQPRVISDILGTMILGWVIQQASPAFLPALLFPPESLPVLRALASLGLMVHLFLVCVKVDPSVVWRSGAKPFAISACSILLSVGLVWLIAPYAGVIVDPMFLMYAGVFTAMTAFPVLADTLREFGLLNSELGRLAMSTAMAGDVMGWLLMVSVAIFTQVKGWGLTSGLLKLASYASILLFTVFVFRPWMQWIVRYTPRCGRVGEGQIIAIITTVVALGLHSELNGLTSIAGPIFLGLAVPDGPPIGAALVERVGAFPTTVALPLFFTVGGLISFRKDFPFRYWRVASLILSGYVGKIVGTMAAAAFFYRAPVRNAMFLALMMGFTGIIETVMLMAMFVDLQRSQADLYSTFLASALITGAICAPLVSFFYDPMHGGHEAGRPTIQQRRSHAEFRVLMCVHKDEAVPAMLELMDASCGADGSPRLCVYVLHLVELVGRSSSSLIAHKSNPEGPTSLDPIHNAFIGHARHQKGRLTVLPFTTISPPETMHQDVYAVARDKTVAVVIVPYPRKDSTENTDANALIRQVATNVLAKAPCSVGILVHHGFSTRVPASPDEFFLRVLVLFWGGPDDREALSYASVLLRQPGVHLTVVRFLPSTDLGPDKDLAPDEALMAHFLDENAGNGRVDVRETVVTDAVQTITAIRSIDGRYGLAVVGRQQGSASLLDEKTIEMWSESSALGPLGEMLATPDFDHLLTTVLVIQQQT